MKVGQKNSFSRVVDLTVGSRDHSFHFSKQIFQPSLAFPFSKEAYLKSEVCESMHTYNVSWWITRVGIC